MICAIVLAAGRSRRMGKQKLLLPLGGAPMIARIVDETLRSPVHQVFVVTGPDSTDVRAALGNRPVVFVENRAIESEMLDSVRCGLRELPEQCKAMLVVLGDQPGLTSGLIAHLAQCFASTGKGLVLPSHKGKRGHPPLISMKYRNEILTQYDDSGLRGLFNAHPEDLSEVEVTEPDSMEDMDYPEDYQRIAAEWERPRPEYRNHHGVE